MPKTKATRKIVLNTYRRTTVRIRRSAEDGICGACNANTVFMSPDDAAIALNRDIRVIFGLIQEGRLHVRTIRDFAIQICGNSLRSVDTTPDEHDKPADCSAQGWREEE